MKTQALKLIRPQTEPEKRTRTVLDTIAVTQELSTTWLNPPFQRPLRENAKVVALSEEIKTSGVIPGIITLGVLSNTTYVIDGQHRMHAFRISAVREGYVDVRIHYFASMADMGEEFVRLNSQLVRMRPDDMLRGLEGSVDALRKIRERCSFVGYDHLRRGGHNCPIVSMSSIIRCWRGSATDVPASGSSGMSASTIAQNMDASEVDHLIDFLLLAVAAFGRDVEYSRLWGSLNLCITMWLYRQIVLGERQTPNSRSVRISKEQFKKCLMSLSASTDYVDWLVGRLMGDRDRSPAYQKIKAAFASRLHADTGDKVKMPGPGWSHG